MPIPTVSIALPVYNQGAFLQQALKPILAVTALSLELIIIDDGSTDNTKEVLRSYSAHPLITIVTNEKNGGVARALNQGFVRASGEYFTWTSADNIHKAGCLEALANYLWQNPGVDFVYANVSLIDDEGRPIKETQYREINQHPGDQLVLHLPQIAEALGSWHDNFINACFMYRRTLGALVGHYNPTLPGVEDFDYWLRALAVGKLAHLDSNEALYDYRLHSASLTSIFDSKKLETSAQSTAYRTRRIARSEPTAGKLINVENARLIEALKAHPAIRWSSEFSLGSPPSLELFDRENQRVTLHLSELSPLAEHLPSPLDACCPFNFGQVHLSSSARVSTVLHAPLNLSPILVRAREENFKAVLPEKESRSIAAIFCPENHSPSWAALPQLIARSPKTCFVLIAASSGQRNLANSLHQELIGDRARNLRIIDLREGQPSGFGPEEWDLSTQLSLMFVLSSVDFVLALESSLTVTRAVFSIAAATGRGVLDLSAHTIPYTIIPSLPWVYRLKDLPQEDNGVLAEGMRELAGNLSTRLAQDQWLDKVALGSFFRQISNLYLAQRLEGI